MLEIFDKNRKLTAILENAFNMTEELIINSISTFEFMLPENDPKNSVCQPFYYVRHNGGGLYRLMANGRTVTETGDNLYKCEHVLALLIDQILECDHVIGNLGIYTHRVIEWLLDKQDKRYDTETKAWLTDPLKQRNWVLGECDFNRQFEYAWTDETLLSALMSVSNRFTEPYIWTFDTHKFPFVLNLKRLQTEASPSLYVRKGKNALKISKQADMKSICTRIFPKGEGEGVNQANIRSVNGGLPYLQSPAEIVEKYGIIERVWVDRRYSNPESLLEAAKSMLNELQEPFEEYGVEVADLSGIPELGGVIDIPGLKRTFITGIRLNDGEVSQITIANKPRSIAGTVAEMLDRQRIEMTYAQGATNIFQDHVYENADRNFPAQLDIMLPSDLRIINKIMINVEIGPFRKPFSVTGGGGALTVTQSSTTSSGASTMRTTDSGGRITSGPSSESTSRSGGGSASTTQSGGGSATSTQDGGRMSTSTDSSPQLTSGASSSHTTSAWTDFGTLWIEHLQTGMTRITSTPNDHFHTVNRFGISGLNHSHRMEHSHNVPAHSHGFSTPLHSHSFTAPAHSHSFTAPAHSHGIEHRHSLDGHDHGMNHTHSIEHSHNLPNHSHSLQPGISLDGSPTSFQLRINGTLKKSVAGTELKEDITRLLSDGRNRIPRDVYHRITILPDAPAYVMMTLTVQGFIQSRGDITV
jgi:phage minor structural protein